MSPSKPAVWHRSWRVVICCGRALVQDPEVRQVRADRGVEIDHALVDELHDERARPELRDGPDLEDRVGGGFHAGGPAQHAGGVVDDLTVREDGHGRGRDVVLLDQPGQLVGDPGLHLVQGAHGPHRTNVSPGCVRPGRQERLGENLSDRTNAPVNLGVARAPAGREIRPKGDAEPQRGVRHHEVRARGSARETGEPPDEDLDPPDPLDRRGRRDDDADGPGGRGVQLRRQFRGIGRVRPRRTQAPP